jgi:hypothetical protein
MGGARRITEDREPSNMRLALKNRETLPVYEAIVVALTFRRCPVFERPRDQMREELSSFMASDDDGEA